MDINDIIIKCKTKKTLSNIVKMLKNNEELLSDVINFTNFLEDDAKIKKRLYHIKHDLYSIPKCDICGCDKKWDDGENRYSLTCKSRKCAYKYNSIINPHIEEIRRNKISITQKNKSKEEKVEIRNKIKKTNIEKYGVDSYTKTKEFKKHMKDTYGYVSPFELKETHKKSKITLINNTGYDHNFKIPDVKKKRKETFIKKYGVNTPTKNKDVIDKSKITNLMKYSAITYTQTTDCQNKIKNKNLEKYGVVSYTQTKEYKEKYKRTCLEKYGVEHWMQNDENYDKFINLMRNNKKTSYKEYKLNDGRVVYLQGYEDYVLFEILFKKYDISDIIISNMDITKLIGKIYYTFEGIEHKYYPDFYIKSENKIIEVKSTYTYNKNREKNDEKMKSCLNKNINFEYIILDGKEYRKWSKKNKKI